jgi:hypothetical protein
LFRPTAVPTHSVALAVFQQVVDFVVAQAGRIDRIVAEVAELAGGAVEQVEAVEGADPQPAAAVFQHRPHGVVGQAGPTAGSCR